MRPNFNRKIGVSKIKLIFDTPIFFAWNVVWCYSSNNSYLVDPHSYNKITIGEGGIRTHGSLHFIWFQIRRNRPTLPPLLCIKLNEIRIIVKKTPMIMWMTLWTGKKGFEPLTPWFVATCSSPLSYKPFVVTKINLTEN